MSEAASADCVDTDTATLGEKLLECVLLSARLMLRPLPEYFNSILSDEETSSFRNFVFSSLLLHFYKKIKKVFLPIKLNSMNIVTAAAALRSQALLLALIICNPPSMVECST